MKASKEKSARNRVISGKMAAKIVASENWCERLEMCDGRPDNFLRLFIHAGIDALSHAARDKSASRADRASAGYQLASVVKQAADSLAKEFPSCSGDESAPDCGFIRSTVAAVEAMHRAARMNPSSFQWIQHYQTWPVLLAPDGTLSERCRSVEELNCGGLFSAARLPVKKAKFGKGRTTRLGGIWPELAVQMYHRAGLGHEIIHPSEAWKVVRTEMVGCRNEIMSRPEVLAWAKTGVNSVSKDSLIWSRLVEKVRLALMGILRT